LLNFFSAVQKLFDFLHCLCFRFDPSLGDFHPDLATIPAMKPRSYNRTKNRATPIAVNAEPASTRGATRLRRDANDS
jgi:hypothetical protein